MTSDYRQVQTARLDLRAVTAADLDALHALHSDPRVWTHLPAARHADAQQTAVELAGWVREWGLDGLGYWAVRLVGTEALIGIAGCAVPPGQHRWNLYYRVRPESQGQGIASEASRAAIAAAHAVAADRPVTAYLLAHNDASRATALALGLIEFWRGHDAGNPDPAAARLVFADRPLAADVLAEMVRSGEPSDVAQVPER